MAINNFLHLPQRNFCNTETFTLVKRYNGDLVNASMQSAGVYTILFSTVVGFCCKITYYIEHCEVL